MCLKNLNLDRFEVRELILKKLDEMNLLIKEENSKWSYHMVIDQCCY